MKAPFIIMQVIFWGYLLFTILRYGLQPSVSETVYKLPKNQRWIFTIILWSFSMLAIALGLELTDNGLVFLAGCGILLVGAAPYYHKKKWDEDEDTPDLQQALMHSIGAIVGVVAILIFMVAIGYWWISLSVVVLSGFAYLVKSMRKKIVMLVEIFTFAGISLSYLLMIWK